MDKIFQTVKGSCLCGQVQYQAKAFYPQAAHCHCNMCKKFHGAAFSTFAETVREDFQWLKGQALLTDFLADNGSLRQFCSHCGSSLTFASASNDCNSIEFSLASLDTPINLSPDAHIHTEGKVSWLTLADALPKLPQGRD